MHMNPMKWTDHEVFIAMDKIRPMDRALEQARQAFASANGQIEQAGLQRGGLSPIQMRRMEFAAVLKIIAAYNNGV